VPPGAVSRYWFFEADGSGTHFHETHCDTPGGDVGSIPYKYG
jgi:hypothetical protein